MGIYETKTGKVPLPELSKKQLALFVIAIIALLFLLFFAMALSEALKPRAIVSSLSPNPLGLSKQQSTVLKVRVFNPSGEAAEKALVRAEPIASDSIIVFPPAHIIPKLGSNEFRDVIFSLRPNPSTKISPGSYKIKIMLLLGGKEFTEEVVLTIKAV